MFLTQSRAHSHAEVAIVDAEILGPNATALVAALGKNSNWQLARPDKLALFVEWLCAAPGSRHSTRPYTPSGRARIADDDENRRLQEEAEDRARL